MLSFRYLKSKKNQKLPSLTTTLSLLAISLSVATLIVVMSVMNGFRAELVEKIIGVNGHIAVYSANDNKVVDYERKISEIEKLPGVVNANAMLEGQAMMIVQDSNFVQGVLIKGYRWSDVQKKSLIKKALKGLTESQFNSSDGVYVGSAIAQKLGLKAGSWVVMVAPSIHQSIFGFLPRYKQYVVSGIFEIGMPQFDSTTVIMNIDNAQRFLNIQNGITAIEVETSDPNQTALISENIKSLIKWGGRVVDWQEENKSFIHALKVEKNVMFLILSLFIVISSLTILISLVMLVSSKNKNIAMLRAMGMQASEVVMVFFLVGIIIGVVGILTGVAIGATIAQNIEAIRIFIETNFDTKLFEGAVYFLSNLPSKLYTENITSIVFMSLLFCIISSIVPAIKSARTNPSEMLKHES